MKYIQRVALLEILDKGAEGHPYPKAGLVHFWRHGFNLPSVANAIVLHGKGLMPLEHWGAALATPLKGITSTVQHFPVCRGG